jgi:hypothetical protein
MIAQTYDSGSGFMFLLFWLIPVVIWIAALWIVFTKAGQPGWAAIVPIYNLWILVKASGKEQWWFVMFLIPIGNLIALFVIDIALAERFSKGAGFGVGMVFLPFIFYPILAWGSATYRPAGVPMTPAASVPSPGAPPPPPPPPP